MRIFQTALAVVYLVAGCVFATANPPNVVFILADNQGAWTLGCYGNPDIRTPRIARRRACASSVP